MRVVVVDRWKGWVAGEVAEVGCHKGRVVVVEIVCGWADHMRRLGADYGGVGRSRPCNCSEDDHHRHHRFAEGG